MKKSILVVLLAVTMLFSFSTTLYAADEDHPDPIIIIKDLLDSK